MRSQRLLLEDILDRTDRIIANTTRYSREEIESDSNIYEANIRHIEMIVEVVKVIPQEFKDAYPDIPWMQFSRLRNILAHVYFEFGADRIWCIVSEEIPKLREAVLIILSKLGTDPELNLN